MATFLRVEYNRKLNHEAYVEYYSDVEKAGKLDNGTLAVHFNNSPVPLILHNVYHYNFEDMDISPELREDRQ